MTTIKILISESFDTTYCCICQNRLMFPHGAHTLFTTPFHHTPFYHTSFHHTPFTTPLSPHPLSPHPLQVDRMPVQNITFSKLRLRTVINITVNEQLISLPSEKPNVTMASQEPWEEVADKLPTRKKIQIQMIPYWVLKILLACEQKQENLESYIKEGDPNYIETFEQYLMITVMSPNFFP